MKLKITGSGYVGLDSGAFLAEVGNDVLCLDVNAKKTPILKLGRPPICSRVILCKAGLNYSAIGRKT
jgi:UDP-glucose 6-dehydrogenase